MNSQSPIPPNILVTAFAIWISIYFSLIIIQDTIFGWATHLTIVATFIVYVILKSLKVSPASKENVTSFFETMEEIATTDSLSKLKSSPNIENEMKDFAVIAHRGARFNFPENSLFAFRNCKSLGCAAVEFDLSITKDNTAVVFHDDNTLRITGIDREIRETTFEEVRQMNIAVFNQKEENNPAERIPTFEEAATTCLTMGLKFFIDLKGSDERVVDHILNMFKRYPEMYRNAVITSFSPKIIYKIRRQDPQIIGCLGWRPGFHRFRVWNSKLEDLQLRHSSLLHNWWDGILDCINDAALKWIYWWFLGLSVYLVDKGGVTTEWISYWRKNGVRIYLAMVNCPIEKQFLDKSGEIGYMTDTLQVNTG